MHVRSHRCNYLIKRLAVCVLSIEWNFLSTSRRSWRGSRRRRMKISKANEGNRSDYVVNDTPTRRHVITVMRERDGPVRFDYQRFEARSGIFSRSVYLRKPMEARRKATPRFIRAQIVESASLTASFKRFAPRMYLVL